jgi:hypothetical protein
LSTATPPASDALRTLTWDRLLRALPLPGFAAADLAAVDAAPGPAPDIAPYAVQLAWTRATGVTLVQDGPTAPALVLAAGERVAVADVKVVVKPKAGP